MIIKATIKDNDFSYDILEFFKNFPKNIHFDINKKIDDFEVSLRLESNNSGSQEDLNELYKLEHQYRLDTQRFAKLYQCDVWSAEDKAWLTEKIKNSLYSYIASRSPKEYCDPPEIQAKYFLKNLKLKFLKSFTEKWENGEVIYWFQHSNMAIVQ